MNVYDFDNTIYRGDSTFQFVLWLYGHRPITLISLPRTLFFGVLYGLHVVPKLTFKENLYHMFVYVKDMDIAADTFIKSHLDQIKTWYAGQSTSVLDLPPLRCRTLSACSRALQVPFFTEILMVAKVIPT